MEQSLIKVCFLGVLSVFLYGRDESYRLIYIIIRYETSSCPPITYGDPSGPFQCPLPPHLGRNPPHCRRPSHLGDCRYLLLH